MINGNSDELKNGELVSDRTSNVMLTFVFKFATASRTKQKQKSALVNVQFEMNCKKYDCKHGPSFRKPLHFPFPNISIFLFLYFFKSHFMFVTQK